MCVCEMHILKMILKQTSAKPIECLIVWLATSTCLVSLKNCY